MIPGILAGYLFRSFCSIQFSSIDFKNTPMAWIVSMHLHSTFYFDWMIFLSVIFSVLPRED